MELLSFRASLFARAWPGSPKGAPNDHIRALRVCLFFRMPRRKSSRLDSRKHSRKRKRTKLLSNNRSPQLDDALPTETPCKKIRLSDSETSSPPSTERKANDDAALNRRSSSRTPSISFTHRSALNRRSSSRTPSISFTHRSALTRRSSSRTPSISFTHRSVPSPKPTSLRRDDDDGHDNDDEDNDDEDDSRDGHEHDHDKHDGGGDDGDDGGGDDDDDDDDVSARNQPRRNARIANNDRGMNERRERPNAPLAYR